MKLFLGFVVFLSSTSLTAANVIDPKNIENSLQTLLQQKTITFPPEVKDLLCPLLEGDKKELQLQRFQHDDWVRSVQWSPDGKKVTTASWDKTARIWDPESGRELKRFKHDSWVYSVQWSPDGRKVATASWDKTARIWDPESGRELK